MHNLFFRGVFLTLAAIALSLPAPAQNLHSWTLRQCIDYARENNIQVKTQELTLESAEASLEQAKAAQYPTLNF